MPRNEVCVLLGLFLSFSAAEAQAPIVAAPNSWTMGTPMPTARHGTFTGVIGSKIYVIGGQNNSGTVGVNEIYDTTTNSWSTGAPQPTPRWVGASAVVNDILYTIGGGSPSSGATSVVEAYDPLTDTWSTKAPMPTTDNSMYATVANNLIFVIGGCCNNGTRLANTLAYDPGTNAWSVEAQLQVGKSLSALGVIGSTVVAAGGLITGGNGTEDNEGYDLATNSWASLAPLPAARQGTCFEAVGSTLYLAGGNLVGDTTPSTSVYSYDATANSWASGLSPMPHAVVNGGSASVDGRLYCFGGSNEGDPYPYEGTVYNYVQMYQPILPAPLLSAGGVITASGFGAFPAIAPGSFVEIYGANLASDTRGWAATDFNGINAPTSLDGTSVSIGGQPAFVNFISPGQVNVLVPSNVPTGAQPLIMTTAAGVSNTYTVNVDAVEPGLLAPYNFLLSGTQYVVAQFLDGTYALPTGAIAGLTSRPAVPGDILVIYGIGFGPTTPSIPAGQLVQGTANITAPFLMSIGGTPATVLYAGLAPGFTGVYQFNVTVPDAPIGSIVPVTFTLGGVSGTQKLNIAVGQ